MYFKKAFLLALIVVSTACTHVVRHNPVNIPMPGATGEVVLVLSPETSSKVINKSPGINPDSWEVHAGAAVADILPKMLSGSFERVSVTPIRPTPQPKAKKGGPRTLVVQVVDVQLDIGTTVFSDHKVNLVVSAEFLEANGKNLFSKDFTVTGKYAGSDKSATWWGILFPGMAAKGMDQAIDQALTNSVIALSQELTRAIAAAR